MQEQLEIKTEVGHFREIDDNALVKQDNELINTKWKMNINQTRVFLTAVSMIHTEDNEFIKYKISAKQLKEMLELKGNSIYSQLETDIPKLMRTLITKKTKSKIEWINVVSYASYENGDLYIKFSEEMKPYLLQLKEQFTVFKLKDVVNFKTKYSMRLAQCLFQFNSMGWRYFKLEELRELFLLNKDKKLDIKQDKYKSTSDFKKRILMPVLEDLANVFPNLEYEEHKNGNSIVAYKFTWKKARAKKVTKILEPTTELGKAILRCMKEIGLSPLQQNTIIESVRNSTHDIDFVWNTMRGIRQQIENKNIRGVSKGGYAVKILRPMLELPL